MTSNERLYQYIGNVLNNLETQKKEAEKLYERADKNYEEMKWIKAELLDLIEKDEKLEECKCSV